MWIFDGIIMGILLGVLVVGIFFVVGLLLDNGYVSTKLLVIPAIPAIIVFAICVILGVRMQTIDKYVDFYNEDGQIIETYQITDYDTKRYGDGVAFYLTDGRVIVKQDCVYNIRFEGEKKR